LRTRSIQEEDVMMPEIPNKELVEEFIIDVVVSFV